MMNPYNQIAAEYYDASLHPTCANFHETGGILLHRWWSVLWRRAGAVCEIGPGRSILAEKMDEAGEDLSGMVLVDSAPEMLRWSACWVDRGAHAEVADATALPFRANSIDLLVSAMGDAYNTPAFWSEVSRVLTIGGRGMYVTPAFEWAQSFRRRGNVALEEAVFVLSDGIELAVPSFVYSLASQTALIEQSGLAVSATSSVTSAELAGAISPKLAIVGNSSSPIATGFLLVKPAPVHDRDSVQS